MRILYITSFLLISFSCLFVNAFAQESEKTAKTEAKVIYKYKSSEFYDFSEMSVEGNLIAPGDLTLSLRDRKDFDYNYPPPQSFDKQILDDLQEIQ